MRLCPGVTENQQLPGPLRMVRVSESGPGTWVFRKLPKCLGVQEQQWAQAQRSDSAEAGDGLVSRGDSTGLAACQSGGLGSAWIRKGLAWGSEPRAWFSASSPRMGAC